MAQITLNRLMVSIAVIAVGVALFAAFTAGKYPSTGVYLWIGIILWLALGTSIGAGIYNLFERPLRGAVMGLIVQIIFSILLALVG